MKKFLAMMMVVMMAAVMFVACGEKEPNEIKGEVFDAGEVSVLVPGGWKAYPVEDLFSDNDENDTSKIQMAQGTGDMINPFTDSYLQIDYYGADTFAIAPDSSYYDDVEDIAPLELDNYTWTGFKANSYGYGIAVFWAEDGDEHFQVMVWYDTGSKKIDLESNAFKAILGSIAPSAAAAATAEAAQ